MKFISIGPWMLVQWSRQASFVLLIYILGFQGAGVGRVTKDVLLHLFSEVVLLEPVQPLIAQALAASQSWKGINDSQKSVLFLKQPLQGFNPSHPITEDIIFAHAGAPIDPKQPHGYDVIWCQWCLGHLSDRQLVRFLKQSKQSLRPRGVIIVKENCCAEEKPGEPESIYDPDDSSVTRHVERGSSSTY
jgi:protein N-terminal methyltransferase